MVFSGGATCDCIAVSSEMMRDIVKAASSANYGQSSSFNPIVHAASKSHDSGVGGRA